LKPSSAAAAKDCVSGKDRVSGFGRGLAAYIIVAQHGVDDYRALRLGITDEIAHGVGGFVEKRP
jgi:hypothetical protein